MRTLTQETIDDLYESGLRKKPTDILGTKPLPISLFTYYFFPHKIFPFLKNSMGMKDNKVDNKTRMGFGYVSQPRV